MCTDFSTTVIFVRLQEMVASVLLVGGNICLQSRPWQKLSVDCRYRILVCGMSHMDFHTVRLLGLDLCDAVAPL